MIGLEVSSASGSSVSRSRISGFLSAHWGRVPVLPDTGGRRGPPEHWYYAGRDHIFLAIGADVHDGELCALALASQPPGLRERLTGTREPAPTQVELLPARLLAGARER